MKATMESTTMIVPIAGGEGGFGARVWQGETFDGIRFTALIVAVHVNAGADHAVLTREVANSIEPSIETQNVMARISFKDARQSPAWPMASAKDVNPKPPETREG